MQIHYSYENTRKTWNTDFIIVCQNLIDFNPISYPFGIYMDGYYLFEKKNDLILAGNLNSSCCYLITAVIGLFYVDAYAKL